MLLLLRLQRLLLLRRLLDILLALMLLLRSMCLSTCPASLDVTFSFAFYFACAYEFSGNNNYYYALLLILLAFLLPLPTHSPSTTATIAATTATSTFSLCSDTMYLMAPSAMAFWLCLCIGTMLLIHHCVLLYHDDSELSFWFWMVSMFHGFSVWFLMSHDLSVS